MDCAVYSRHKGEQVRKCNPRQRQPKLTMCNLIRSTTIRAFIRRSQTLLALLRETLIKPEIMNSTSARKACLDFLTPTLIALIYRVNLSINCPNVAFTPTISSVHFNITVKHFQWFNPLFNRDAEKYTQLLI